MGSKISVVDVDKTFRFNRGVVFMFDSIKNKVGSYDKSKVERFKKKVSILLEKAGDAYLDFDGAVNDAFDSFTDKIIDGFDTIADDLKKHREENSETEKVSAIDKLQPIMSEEEFRKLGIDIESADSITELQEFKKELMMDNFHSSDNDINSTRRGSRGTLNIWMSVLISILFIGVFIIIGSFKS